MSEVPELEILVSPSAVYADAGDAALEKAKGAFESLAETPKEVVLPVHQALDDHAPDEFELRLELAFKGEAKWVVVSACGQATIGIKRVWKRKAN